MQCVHGAGIPPCSNLQATKIAYRYKLQLQATIWLHVQSTIGFLYNPTTSGPVLYMYPDSHSQQRRDQNTAVALLQLVGTGSSSLGWLAEEGGAARCSGWWRGQAAGWGGGLAG